MTLWNTEKIIEKIKERDKGIFSIFVLLILASVWVAGKNEKLSLLYLFLSLVPLFVYLMSHFMDQFSQIDFDTNLDRIGGIEIEILELKQYGLSSKVINPFLIKKYESLHLVAIQKKEFEIAEELKKKIEKLKEESNSK